MRRLTAGVRALRADTRGAVAPIVAMLMVPLLGFTALGVDYAKLASEKTQLHNGADAAALAIAQSCAAGSCGSPTATAQSLADANALDGSSGVDTPTVGANSVTVTTRSRDAATGRNLVPFSFAPAIGIPGATASASATARWGSPSAGPAILPIAFSYCAFQDVTPGVETLIAYVGQSTRTCNGPSGKVIPGGFGWLQSVSGQCQAVVDIATAQTPGEPGNSFPGICDSQLQIMKTQTVLLPIYQDADGTGSGGWYQLYGFAAFRMTGYRFGGSVTWNSTTAPSCTGNCRGIKGYFTRYVSLDRAFTLGGPDLGGSVVTLAQ